MYTVQQVARISGTSVRTIRYYDQRGLLKPAQIGSNGYRYYGEKELLRLQQILLYREMDVPLERIGKIMSSQLLKGTELLKEHRKALILRKKRITKLIKTVDKTIDFLQGEAKMENQQLFEGFGEKQQELYAKEAQESWDPKIVQESQNKWLSYTEDEKKAILEEGAVLYQDLALAMDQGPRSTAAIEAITRWRKHMEYFWSPRKDQLLPLAQMYSQDERFKKNIDKNRPGLSAFIAEVVEYMSSTDWK